MSRRIIKLKDVDPLLFAGVGEENLRALRKNFDAQIIARGNKLTIEGPDEEVERIAEIVDKLCEQILQGKLPSPETVVAEIEGVGRKKD